MPTVFQDTYNHTHLAANATTVVKAKPGILRSIVINDAGASANTITVYDNTAGSGTVIAVIDSVTAGPTLLYDVKFKVGLTIVIGTGTAGDITVCWS